MASERNALLATIQHLTTRLQALPEHMNETASVGTASIKSVSDKREPLVLNIDARKAEDKDSVVRKEKAKQKKEDTRSEERKAADKAKMAKLREARQAKKLATLTKPEPAKKTEKSKAPKLNIVDVSESESEADVKPVEKPKKVRKPKSTNEFSDVPDKIMLKVRPL